MTLSECINTERKIKSAFRRSLSVNIAVLMLFVIAMLLLLGYENMYMQDIILWIVDVLSPVGEALAGLFFPGDPQAAADAYRSAALSVESLLIIQMIIYILTITVPMFCFLKTRGRKISFGFPAVPAVTPKPVLTAVFALGAGYIASLIGTLIFSFLPTSGGYDSLPDTASGVILYFISLVILPAIFEEWAFRGVILRSLLPYGRTFAVVFSSLVFGLMHLNPPQSLFAFVLGLVMGYAFTATGSIWPGVFIHAVNNAVSFAAQYAMLSDDYGFPAIALLSVFMYGSMIFAVAFLVFILVRRRSSPFYTEPARRHFPGLTAANILSSSSLCASFAVMLVIYLVFVFALFGAG